MVTMQDSLPSAEENRERVQKRLLTEQSTKSVSSAEMKAELAAAENQAAEEVEKEVADLKGKSKK